ncbi:hypothetical protein BJ138DRAFT_815714 [Hygrophoropsis aurantiaca]|uniref:Uncharacterized protein n=1 Tax=Hygrophoropsis aurantiaca TaxID=72124 RepID=A0ACB8AHN8_9AGAM|nr:hypothetical protein BJ138DRAFT_815714 [Hygrophoropsis aurantiaca]
MTSLPRKPDFSPREPGIWPDPTDSRHSSGRPPPMPPPGHYRDSYRQDERDTRERNDRPRYSRESPHRPANAYGPSSQNDYDGRNHREREYKDSWTPSRDQVWEPDRRPLGRDWQRGDQRPWIPRTSYGSAPNRPSESSQRGYDKNRHEDRPRSRNADYDRGPGPEYERDRDYDRPKHFQRSPPRHDGEPSAYRRGRSISRSPPRGGMLRLLVSLSLFLKHKQVLPGTLRASIKTLGQTDDHLLRGRIVRHNEPSREAPPTGCLDGLRLGELILVHVVLSPQDLALQCDRPTAALAQIDVTKRLIDGTVAGAEVLREKLATILGLARGHHIEIRRVT